MSTPQPPTLTEIEAQLEFLARQSSPSQAAVTHEAVTQRIDALEDFYIHRHAARSSSSPYGAEPGLDLGL